VKFDKLNIQKRKFKCIFSIHKRLPFAVIPLDPARIEIDFAKARLPLSDDALAEGARWYQEYDINEKEPLKAILAPFVEVAEEVLRERKKWVGEQTVPRFRCLSLLRIGRHVCKISCGRLHPIADRIALLRHWPRICIRPDGVQMMLSPYGILRRAAWALNPEFSIAGTA
jgi:hypothetical protein